MNDFKIPAEDLEELEDIIMSDGWAIVLKYIKIMQTNQQDRFLNCEPNDPMLYYRQGAHNGSKELLEEILKFKKLVSDRLVR
jgi:polyphosphate kinase 2 (PPK2 family)